MIWYSIVRVGESKAAAVLVERKDLLHPQSEILIHQIEALLQCRVMLIARDETDWTGARVHALFEADPFYYTLLQSRDIDWCELHLPECVAID